MKPIHSLKKWLPLTGLVLTLSCPAWAQAWVGTVDMQKVFNDYWKTRQSKLALQQKENEFKKTDQQMIAQWQRDQNKYHQLLLKAENPALSAKARKQDQQKAQQQYQTNQSEAQAISQFEQQSAAELNTEEDQMHQELLSDIRAAVAQVASARGCSTVVDAVAGTVNPADNPPAIVYAGSQIDLTQKVLAQLNAGAPLETPASGQ